MGITKIDKDLAALTLTVYAEYNVSVERAWQLWSDPRQLERWWGPPTWPATVTDHDMRPGGRMNYYMTGPDGTKAPGYWDFVDIVPPHHLEVRDGFSDATGTPIDSMPRSRMTIDLNQTPTGSTEIVIRSEFESLEAMQLVLDMGVVEGMTQAMGQIDGILADTPA